MEQSVTEKNSFILRKDTAASISADLLWLQILMGRVCFRKEKFNCIITPQALCFHLTLE